ncbi:MAG: hypothetical protein VYA65_12860, partial [Pseudomonadota bacterium]|nr:hypothetical protein [Pseudomonadota bacterium]
QDFETAIDLLDVSLLTGESNIGSSYSTFEGYTGGNPFDPELGYLALEQVGEDTHINVDFDGVAGNNYSMTTFITLVGVNMNVITSANFLPELELVVSGGTGG